MSNEHIIAPIFRPLRARFQPLGIPAGKFLIIICTALAGVVVSLLLGYWTHEVDVEYTAQERQALLTDYQNVARLAASTEEQLSVALSQGNLTVTDTQAEALQNAKDLGIRSDMTAEELEALIPISHPESQPVIPLFVRLAVLAVLPTIALVVWFMELNRTSLQKEAHRRIKYLRSQKTYRCAPREYVERVAGTTYWAAISKAASGKDAK